MKKRNLKVNLTKIIEIHNSYLGFLNKVQKFQEQKNNLSKKSQRIMLFQMRKLSKYLLR